MSPSRGTSSDFCFVHAADLHLDTPFQGIGETAPEVAAALREASLDAFDNLIDVCLRRQAAFLLIAGDVYDGAQRGIRAQFRFRDGLARLSEAGIAALVVHGNHDPVDSGWSAIGSWPPLVTIFGADAVESVAVCRGDQELALVHGISFWRRDIRENLALRFARRENGPAFQIGLLHCNVAGSGEGHEPYSPCTLEDLRGAGLDYWALGHVHTRSVLSGQCHGDEPWVVYPGNLQARSPKPSERGAKGAVVVEVCDGRVARLEPVACDLIRYAALQVDVTSLSSLDAVRDALEDAAEAELAAADGRAVVARGHLVGRGEVHAALAREGALAGLLAVLRDIRRPGPQWCWWDGLEDASSGELDLEELRGGSDFAADLIAEAEALLAACTAPPRLELGLAATIDGQLLEDITSSLPKALRSRALELDLSGPDLLSAGLVAALDELVAGDSASSGRPPG